VVDLLLGDVKPREVGIHGGGSGERLLQPRIIASGKALQRELAYLSELVNIVLEGLVAKETAALGAQGEGGFPPGLFECRGRSRLKRDALIPTLHRRDVSQEGANRVTGVIMQMIQFRNAQAFDGGECGLARVEQNAHQSPDRRRVTWQGLETERW
jgi:hypothetical protein